VKLDFAGAPAAASSATVFTLAGPDGKGENSFAAPQNIAPQESPLAVPSPQFSYTFPANSLTVLRLKLAN
jgi:alpha-N-arabinofuranosidase